MTLEDIKSGKGALRADLQVIADLVVPGSRVLDVGCGDGALLAYLDAQKRADGRGVEISQTGVNSCVAHGLSVIQGDADADLKDYPSDAFDYVILSQTLQATHNPKLVVSEMVRIGRRAIVSFPNFGFWRVRLNLLFGGRMPVTKALGYAWYKTPNIHLCTLKDFVAMCREVGVTIEKGIALAHTGHASDIHPTGLFTNWLAEQGVYLLKRD